MSVEAEQKAPTDTNEYAEIKREEEQARVGAAAVVHTIAQLKISPDDLLVITADDSLNVLQVRALAEAVLQEWTAPCHVIVLPGRMVKGLKYIRHKKAKRPSE